MIGTYLFVCGVGALDGVSYLLAGLGFGEMVWSVMGWDGVWC